VTRLELETAIAALGRPQPRFLGREDGEPRSAVAFIHRMQTSIRAMTAWDAANPDKAREHERLSGELEALIRREEAALRSLRAADRALERLEGSGAGERSLKVATEPSETAAIAAARAWMGEQPPRWALVLRGPVGTGKSIAAVWALRRAALMGEDVALRKSGEVTRLSGFEAGAAELRMLKRVGLLVLDDVGAEALNEWGRALMCELLDARYEANARTVLTANPEWPVLVERLGQRIVDRIRHGGRVVELSGQSLRGAM
jgi:DNA replication protein DnaC